MKILNIISSMDPSTGGLPQVIRSLVPGLKKLEIESEVVCLDSVEPNYGIKDDFTIHALGKGKGAWYYNPTLFTWLINNIANYDAVIIHGLWQYPGFAAYRAFKYLISHKRKVPKLYVMPHGMLDPYFQKAPDRKLKAIRNWFYWKLIEKKAINFADGLFFTCEEEMILARKTFRPYHPKTELNIGYGIVEPPPYTSAMGDAFLKIYPQAKEQKYLLFLSRIHKKKGIENLINAYVQISKKGFNNLPMLVVAGPCLENSYKEKITAIVNSHPILKKNVFFSGMLSGDAKWGAFYNCEAFVLPSHQENFGIAVAEALACGKQVLISNQVNIWREIEGSQAGLVEDDTIEGTKTLLVKWLAMDGETKVVISENAKRCFLKYFTVEHSVKMIYKAISKV